jgi:hypothetical protein
MRLLGEAGFEPSLHNKALSRGKAGPRTQKRLG